MFEVVFEDFSVSGNYSAVTIRSLTPLEPNIGMRLQTENGKEFTVSSLSFTPTKIAMNGISIILVKGCNLGLKKGQMLTLTSNAPKI